MFNKILIPIDDSTIVRKLIKRLPTVIDLSDKEFFLVHVSDPYPPRVYSDSALSEFYVGVKHHRESCNAFANKVFKTYQKMLLQAKRVELVHTFDDDIPNGIIQAAKKNKVDVIAMTTHRYTGLKSILLGNKVHDVIVNSKYPILVI
jgi:nucleotide-binding universal stress UspA family protein